MLWSKESLLEKRKSRRYYHFPHQLIVADAEIADILEWPLKRIDMTCEKPCTDFDTMCESCMAELESTAVESAMNMGTPDWLGPFSPEELEEIQDFLDNNRGLMEDLKELEKFDK